MGAVEKKILALKVGLLTGAFSCFVIGAVYLLAGKNLEFLLLWLIVAFIIFGFLGWLFIQVMGWLEQSEGSGLLERKQKRENSITKATVNYSFPEIAPGERE